MPGRSPVGHSTPADQTYNFDSTMPHQYVIRFVQDTPLVGPFDSEEEARAYGSRQVEALRGTPHAVPEEPVYYWVAAPKSQFLPSAGLPPIGVARGGPKWGEAKIPPVVETQCQFVDYQESSVTGLRTQERCSRKAEFEIDVEDGESTYRGCPLHIGFLAKDAGAEEMLLVPVRS